MASFKKKADPLSDRARDLSAEIAALEAKIKKLDSQLQQNPPPKSSGLRSTALPDGRTISHSTETATGTSPTIATPQSSAMRNHEPIFEAIDQDRLKSREEPATTPEHYNELGVRKYDLPALVRRLRNEFSGPSTTNPKLVNYLAAGGIQGLRPLRYEKRVARNRFVALVIVILTILLGIFLVFFK